MVLVLVADGSREADEKLQRVLTCDPGLGVVRHADAGYQDALDTVRDRGIDMPMPAAPATGMSRSGSSETGPSPKRSGGSGR